MFLCNCQKENDNSKEPRKQFCEFLNLIEEECIISADGPDKLFTIVESPFDSVLIFDLSRVDGNYYLRRKIISSTLYNYTFSDTLIQIFYRTYSVRIDKQTVSDLDSLLSIADFWEHPKQDFIDGFDGTTIEIDYRRDNRLKYVGRTLRNNDSFLPFLDYLFKLSDLNSYSEYLLKKRK